MAKNVADVYQSCIKEIGKGSYRMLTAVKSWPTSASGKDFEAVLYRAGPNDYPKELYEPWYKDPSTGTWT
ncbi:hypothetical protein [Acetomicrobium sp.]|uniref:hypothetical protein n=1 Tax=Acetomicrobium sp. TaxID=1872099 RepID=UPI002FC901CE